jgi:hypothetical protein
VHQGRVALRIALGRKALLAERAGPGAQLQVDGGAVTLQRKGRLEGHGAEVTGLSLGLRIPVLKPTKQNKTKKKNDRKCLTNHETISLKANHQLGESKKEKKSDVQSSVIFLLQIRSTNFFFSDPDPKANISWIEHSFKKSSCRLCRRL